MSYLTFSPPIDEQKASGNVEVIIVATVVLSQFG